MASLDELNRAATWPATCQIERVPGTFLVIDLAEAESLRDFGLSNWTGRKQMKKLICGLLVLGALGVGSLWAADAFTGTWKLNVAKSKFAKGQEIKEQTAVVTEQGDVATVTVKGAKGDGTAISQKYTFPLKGGTVSFIEGLLDDVQSRRPPTPLRLGPGER
jgi:hypothetical protein